MVKYESVVKATRGLYVFLMRTRLCAGSFFCVKIIETGTDNNMNQLDDDLIRELRQTTLQASEGIKEFDVWENEGIKKNKTSKVSKSTKAKAKNKPKNKSNNKPKDYRAVRVNTILGLVIICVILTIITIVSLCLAISAKVDVKKVYTYTGPSILENSESAFYFDGEKFVDSGMTTE